jgi:hypothetical protein
MCWNKATIIAGFESNNNPGIHINRNPNLYIALLENLKIPLFTNFLLRYDSSK